MGKTVREYWNTAKKKLNDLWEWVATDNIGIDFTIDENGFLIDSKVCEVNINPEYEDDSINGMTVENFVWKFKNENPYRTPTLKIFDVDLGMGLVFNDYLNEYLYEDEENNIIVNNQILNWKETGVIILCMKTKNPVIETANDKPFPKIPVIEEYIKALHAGNKDLINSFDIPKEIVKGYCRSKATNSNYLYIDLGRRKITSYCGACGRLLKSDDKDFIWNLAYFCKSNGIKYMALNENNLEDYIANSSQYNPSDLDVKGLIVKSYINDFRIGNDKYKCMNYYTYDSIKILSKRTESKTEIVDVVVFELD